MPFYIIGTGNPVQRVMDCRFEIAAGSTDNSRFGDNQNGDVFPAIVDALSQRFADQPFHAVPFTGVADPF